jgi:hypothetical protein
MASKRFRTRRLWSNSLQWGVVSLGLMLLAIGLSGISGNAVFMQASLVIALVGAGFAFTFDRPSKITYGIEQNVLVLRRKAEVKRIALAAINDCTLVDRRAARILFLEKSKLKTDSGASKAELSEMRNTFTKWCSVDIGLKSYTFGIGRNMIDNRPDARYDLVLLRLADGSMTLLSPVYNQDMIESLNRTSRLAESDKRRA